MIKTYTKLLMDMRILSKNSLTKNKQIDNVQANDDD